MPAEIRSEQQFTPPFYRFSKVMKIAMIGLLAAFHLFAFPVWAADPTAENLKTHVVIGTAEDNPPFSWRDYNGRPTGFLVDLTEAVSKRTGMVCDLKMYERDTMRHALETGEIGAVNGMRYTLDRDLYFNFSEPVLVVYNTIFVWDEEKKIYNLKSLRGRKVLVERGDIMHEFILSQKLGINLILAKRMRDMIKLLSLHRGEAAVLPRLPALYYMKALAVDNIKEAGKPFEPLELCFAVKDGNKALLDKINQGLLEVKSSGQYDSIKKKWLSPLEPRREIGDYLFYLGATGGLFLFVILFLWIWNWTLSREVRHKTESLRLAHRRLQKVDEFKTEVVHMVAHDVRAPIGVMQGYLDYLGEGLAGNLEPKQKEVIKKIQNSIDRMNRLVSDLLDMAQIESGKLELHASAVDAAHLAAEVNRFFETPLSEKHITFMWEALPASIFFEADRNRIEQCLINLISNAIKHTPRGGEIKLLIKEIQDKVIFEVHDSGEGMDAGHLARLFHKFESGDRGAGRGYGLGLTISQALVQLHGGKIWAQSKEGRGSVFQFSIPRTYKP